MAQPSETDLRQIIRELLREIVADRRAPAGVEEVRLTSDAELQAFVAKLAAPGVIEAIREGKLRFRLAAGTVQIPDVAQKETLYGVISERKLSGCTVGETVFLTRGAVLTPLAQDMGRRLGLKIVRRDG